MWDQNSESDVDSFESSNEGSTHYADSESEVEDLEVEDERLTSEENSASTSECHSTTTSRRRHGVDTDEVEPYAGEPVYQLLLGYNQRRQRWLEDQEELTNRLEHHTNLHEW